MTTLLLTLLLSQPLPPVVYISGPPGRTSIANTNQAFYEHPDGCDLRVRWSDGTVAVLVAADSVPGGLSVTDPCVSLDGNSVLYAHIHRNSRGARSADLWRIDVSTREQTKLTDSAAEWMPPRGSATFAPHPTPRDAAERKQWTAAGFVWQSNTLGVWNTAPCELPGGRIVFTSNRSGVEPTKIGLPALQLYAMDSDGKNVEKLGHLNLGGALHPSVLRNGKIAWSSGEMQGYRDPGMWGIWEIAPDGGQFGPLISSYRTFAAPFHFQTETSNGSLVASQYYQNRTYGALLVAPLFSPSPFGPPTMFGDPLAKKNTPVVKMGHGSNGGAAIVNWQYPFQRRGLFNLVPDQTAQDWNPYVFPDGTDSGASTHPAAAPGNGLLFAMRRGPRDTGEIGVYYVPDVSREYTPQQLIRVVDEPGVMECFPRALVPYSAIHGVAEPARFTSPMDETLLPGEPYGVVGTASLAWRETKSPTKVGGKNAQGGDYGVDTADIEYIGILAQRPNEAKNTPHGWKNYFDERTALYRDLVPISKWRQPDGSVTYGPGQTGSLVTGPDGQRDTSFAVEIPANTPWTFAYLDADHNFLGLAQTWHQLIPGEKYTTCGGCHAHNRPAPFGFEDTFAGSIDYQRPRLERAGPVVEWSADVEPLFRSHCYECHGPDAASPAGGLVLNRRNLYDRGLAGRDFLSRQSMLVKRIYGYDGVTQCPPPDLPQLTASEKRLISWWVGTGMTEGPDANRDSLPPTLVVRLEGTQLIIGATDPDSGLDVSTLAVAASWADPVVLVQDGERWIAEVPAASEGVITASVSDRAGNEVKVTRTFKVE